MIPELIKEMLIPPPPIEKVKKDIMKYEVERQESPEGGDNAPIPVVLAECPGTTSDEPV